MNWAPAFRVLAHELRAPAAVISGYARMLREGRLEGPDREQALAQIELAAGRVSQYGRQASELAQWTSGVNGSPESLGVSALLDQSLGLCAVPPGRLVRADEHEALGSTVRCLNRDALVLSVATVIDAAGRESGEGAVRVSTRRASAGPSAVDLLIGNAEAAAWQAVTEPNPNDSPEVERGGMGLAFILAAAVVLAHGGQFWSVGGRQGVLALRLFADRETRS